MNGTLTGSFARRGALVIGAWSLFGVVQALLELAMLPGERVAFGEVLAFELSLALVWAAMTPGIAWWSRRVSRLDVTMSSRIALHLPAIAVVGVVDTAARRVAMVAIAGLNPSLSFWLTLLYYADVIVASYAATVIVSDSLLARDRLAEGHRVERHLERQLAAARLAFLEMQLQPHFLFNSLGAVMELAHENPATARKVLRQLASMLRFGIANQSPEVTLAEELTALEPYLEIQRIRMSDWLRADYEVDDAALTMTVPRLILQPLVENAIRHGLAKRSAPGRLTIEAHATDRELVLQVRDDGVGLSAPDTSQSGWGIGLESVRERLATRYGNSARFELRGETGHGTVAEIVLPAESPGDGPREEEQLDSTDAIARVAKPLRGWTTVFRISAAWLVIGLLWTEQSFAYLSARGRPTGGWSLVADDLGIAFSWAVLTALIFLIVRRFPIAAPRAGGRAVVFAVIGVVTVLGHVALSHVIVGGSEPILSGAYLSVFVIDMLIYCAVVALGHRRQLTAWLWERQEAAQRLSIQLSEEHERLARLGLDPTRLQEVLQRLADVVIANPSGAEPLLTRLADGLRRALDRSRRADDGVASDEYIDALLSELRSNAKASPEPRLAMGT